MDRKAIYRKTDRGVAEITGKGRAVERRLRPLLILVDGYHTATYIHSLISGIGIQEKDFDVLVAGGFIEPIAMPRMAAAANDPEESPRQIAPEPIQKRSPVDRYCDGKRYLCETAADKLGLKSFLFQLKLEKCSSTDDLMALVPEFEAALSHKLDKDYARHCRRIAESILQN